MPLLCCGFLPADVTGGCWFLVDHAKHLLMCWFYLGQPAATCPQIIAQTAKFVRTNGKQVELVLRVKHGSNANFAFLVPSDRLFPYYR